MADVQVLYYSGENHGDKYEIKKAAFSVKTAKDYTSLSTALTHNFFSKIDIYDEGFADQFKIFYRGYFTKAIGGGMRDIQPFGLSQVRRFNPAKPGDKLCLEVPNGKDDREFIYGSKTMLYSSAMMPFLMFAHDKFIKPDEMFQFQKMKVGEISRSISFYQDLMFSYVLGLSPWGLDNALHHNTYGMTSILGAKWDDTPIANFGDDKQGIGDLIKGIKEDFKKEIDTEKDVKNVNVYPIHEWWPYMVDNKEFPVANRGTKLKKPTQKITTEQAKKIYFDNTKVDPVKCAIAVANCLNHHIKLLTTKLNAKNDPQFPGNLSKEERKKYGTETGKDKPMWTPMKVPLDKLVIVMHPDMYVLLDNARHTSSYIKEGAFKSVLSEILDRAIITIDTIPYGEFKLTTKDRYNVWDLYRKVAPDTLNQMYYTQITAHSGIFFGIRKFQPCTYIKLTGLYINPMVKDDMLGVEDAVDIA